MKNLLQNKRFVSILLVVSLLLNIYLIKELYVAKHIDRAAASNNFMKWKTGYETFTVTLGRVLEDSNNDESYNDMLKSAEIIKVLQTVPMGNYYGKKNMKEIGCSLLKLSAQITYVVEELLYLNIYDDLTEEQLNKLKEFHYNLNLLKIQFNNKFEELRGSNIEFKEFCIELSLLMEDTIESNYNLFPK